MIGGPLVSALVRVVVVVATLAAVSYFVIRPILETTEKVSTGVSQNIQRSLDDAFGRTGISQSRQTVITKKVRSVSGRDMRRLERCIDRAGSNIARINRCASRFSR